MSASHDDHSGPVKTPAQFLWLSIFSFVVPIFIIIGLVYWVTTQSKPSAAIDSETHAMAGMTAADVKRQADQNIAKMGSIAMKDGSSPLKAGAEVYQAQCAACHAAGVAGSPKFQDASAWAPRIKKGYEALLLSALKGKGAMGAQGGGDFEDAEIGRAVVYMTNAAGAKFAEPQRSAQTPDSATASAQTTASAAL